MFNTTSPFLIRRIFSFQPAPCTLRAI